MEFIIKTQSGDLVQVTNFEKDGGFAENSMIVCSGKCVWRQYYANDKRRDEVFEQLETWIGWMLFYNAFGSNEVIMKEQGYDTAPFMIFEFPKE